MSEALRGHLAMLTFSALIAGSFALGAMAAEHIAPVALNALRFVIAAGIVGAGVLAGRGLPRRALAAPWRYGVLGGLMGLYFVLMFESLKTAEPVAISAIFTLSPILSGAAAFVVLRQVMTGRMALALSVGAAGAVWVIFDADWRRLLAFEVGRGEVIFFWGCVAHAFYPPLVAKLKRGEPLMVFAFLTLVGAAVVVGLAGVPALVSTDWAALPPIVWITLVYVSLMATAVTFVLLQYAALRLPSAKVMAYTYLTPTWVLGWQAALGHGLPPPAVLAGVGLTVVALVLLLKDEHPPA